MALNGKRELPRKSGYKVKHWRGVPTVLMLESAPVIEFVILVGRVIVLKNNCRWPVLLLLQLEDVKHYDANLFLLFGAATLKQAHALVNRDERFFGLNTLGANMEGSQMHRQLLKAYEKVQKPQMK